MLPWDAITEEYKNAYGELFKNRNLIIASKETEDMNTSTRNLGNIDPETAKASGWVVDVDKKKWECVSKAHNDSAGIMKSTKRMRMLCRGWLYQVTTEGPKGYAEALAFVPD